MPPDSPSPESAAPGRRYLIAALALTALIQIGLALSSSAVADDGLTFIKCSRAFARAPAATMREKDQHPGYPIMILAGRWLAARFVGEEGVWSWLYGARLVSGICGLLSVPVLWLLARRVFDARVAGVAAVIFAGLPLFRQNAADALSDTPHLLFYLLGAWMAAEGLVRLRFWWFPAAGLASGLAYWIRPEGFSVALVAAAVLVLWAVTHRTMSRRRTLACLAGLLLSAGIVATPYVYVKGAFTTKKKITAVFRREPRVQVPVTPPTPAQEPPGAEAGVGEPFAPTEKGTGVSSFAPSRNRTPKKPGGGSKKTPAPSSARGHAFLEGCVELVAELLHRLRYVLALGLLFGLLAPGRLRAQAAPGFLLGSLAAFHVMLLLWLYSAVRYISYRHTMPLAALAMPWIASGTIYLAGVVATVLATARPPSWSRSPSPGLRRCVLGLMVGLVVLAMVPRSLRPLRRERLPLLRAGSWVGERTVAGDRVLSNSSHMLFYADTPGRFIRPSDAIPEVQVSDDEPPYRFVVLDVRAGDHRKDWLAQLARCYAQETVPGVFGGESGILLFRARSPRASTPP